MSHSQGTQNTFGLTTTRLEALSDGVLAIVITLLILSFADASQGIAGSPNLSSREVMEYLVGLWPHFLGYALSFVLIAAYCLLHHWVFHYIRRADHGLIWLNMLFLMSVSFLPFPTDLLAECILHESNVVVVFYGLSHTVAGVSLAAIWMYASWNRRLLADNVDPETVRTVLRTVLAAPALYTLGAALSLFSSAASIVVYAIVPLIYVIPTRLFRGTTLSPHASSVDLAPHTIESIGSSLAVPPATRVNPL
jgi:uncharacterized membrane protein